VNKLLYNNFPEIAVDSAHDGLDAVKKFKETLKSGNVYLLIFMDLCMPSMDGMEACKLIRKYEQSRSVIRTPIFALSAPSGDSNPITRIAR
jgi:CheY-like chemotaxis protein